MDYASEQNINGVLEFIAGKYDDSSHHLLINEKNKRLQMEPRRDTTGLKRE